MPKLVNSYENCTLLNLGYAPDGKGPYVIRQDAYPPGSTTLTELRFLLRKDGTWVLNLAVFALSEEEKEEFLFEKTTEALELLGNLTGKPTYEDSLPAGKSAAELRAAAESTLTGIWSRIRNARASRIVP